MYDYENYEVKSNYLRTVLSLLGVTRKGNLEALATMRPLEWGLQPPLLHHDFDNSRIVVVDDAVGNVHDVLEEVVQVLLGKVKIYQEERGLDKYQIIPQHRACWLAKREKFDHQELLDGPLLSCGRIVHNRTGPMTPSDLLPWLNRGLPHGGEGDGGGPANGERDEEEVLDAGKKHFRVCCCFDARSRSRLFVVSLLGRGRKKKEQWVFDFAY
jgi:hypothetical protein